MKFQTISASNLATITGGDLTTKLWSSWGYYLGKKARWNLKHPYVSTPM
ncbi:plantaricin NC8 alpha peptide precursor [Lactiplantibacillus pentosus]